MTTPQISRTQTGMYIHRVGKRSTPRVKYAINPATNTETATSAAPVMVFALM